MFYDKTILGDIMNRNNIICKLNKNDLYQLKQLLDNSFAYNISLSEMESLYFNIINDSNTYIFGYFINDKLVGTLTLKILFLIHGKDAMIWDLTVMQEYRQLGIATKLMIYAEKIVKDEKIKRIWLFSGLHRENAHKLYKKLGYNENRDKAFFKEI